MIPEECDDNDDDDLFIEMRHEVYEEPLFPVSFPSPYALGIYLAFGVAGFIADYSYWTTGANPGLSMKIVLGGGSLLVLYLIGVLAGVIDPD